MNRHKTVRTGIEIAIIGMSGRFPGARGIAQFWDNLVNGKETVTFFTDKQLEEAGVEPETYNAPNYVKAKGYIEDIESFDFSFFGYTPREAEVMDAQLRVFYECTWEVFEDAGYDPGAFTGLVGVYAGATPNFYWNALTFFSKAARDLGGIGSGTLRDKDSLSMRISYKLDLKGPSYTLYTACSTSLVAVDQACRGLLTGECDMAAAGGVTITLPNIAGYPYQEGMIYSSDGHLRSFDAGATGTIFCDGAGVVLLKRLEEAIEDRDHIYAVIKGTGVNNDGLQKVGYTAPSSNGQAAVIAATLHLAEVDPGTIGYVEAHGTGTIVGDPIEIEGLTMAFNTDKKQYCRIGSVKANVGHLDCAAGVAGLIKTALVLKHRLIPPSIHFNTPNPKIDFENSPFKVNTELHPWTGGPFPLRAGVSAFGIGGTNAHAVLEEAPPPVEAAGDGQAVRREHHLLLLSAKTPTALDAMTGNLTAFFQANPASDLADAAYTLQVGRRHFQHRRMLAVRNMQEALDILGTPGSRKIRSAAANESKRPVVFMFPGQGSQYVNMGLGLYRNEPVFREEADRCFEILKPLMDYDIKEILYPAEHTAGQVSIDRTGAAQPLIFTVEYALAKLLMSWGITPDAMIGHSIGEYTAAHLSGVFTLEQVLELVALRGKLMQQMPEGGMLSVTLPEKELMPLLGDTVSLAAVNAPSLCVASGPHDAVAALAGRLTAKGIENRLLHTSHAFHSAMMEPILEVFAQKVGELPLKAPRIPYAANVSGDWITVEEALSPQYWARHLRSAVRFSDNLAKVLAMGNENALLVEVGPGRALSTFVHRHDAKKQGHTAVNLVRHPQEADDDQGFLLDKIGRLWLHGAAVDWQAFQGVGTRCRIPLPTYPFERQRCWTEGDPFKLGARQIYGQAPVKRADLAGWFYVPSWKRSPLPEPGTRTGSEGPGEKKAAVSLVFLDNCGLGAALAGQLDREGHEVVTVKAGDSFEKENDRSFIINPGASDHYQALWGGLQALSKVPDRVFHCWNVTGGASEYGWDDRGIDDYLEKSYYSLLNLARAIGGAGEEGPVLLLVVSDHLQEVAGEAASEPLKAVLLGPVRTIPREYPNILCRSVDIRLPGPGGDRAGTAQQLIRETGAGARSPDVVAAYRNGRRWLETFEPLPLESPQGWEPRLKPEGVYLITGGLGGIGLVLAGDLARRVKAKLVLTARSPLPAKEEWQDYLAAHAPGGRVAQKLRKLMEIESYGAEALTVQADVADEGRMKEVLAAVKERWGRLDGVVHSAGVPDAALIQGRSREMSEQVFAAKIRGTLVLWKIIEQEFKQDPPDFFVLCSTISSILAPVGEVAYCAGNAFMDSFARFLNGRVDAPFIAAVGWDAWQGVGMMEEALKKQSGPKFQEIGHPVFTGYSPDEGTYSVYLSVQDHWFLEEHRIMGNCMLSGTAYAELARAAFSHHTGAAGCEIREMYFLNPLVVGRQEKREMRVILEPLAQGCRFSCVSRTAGSKERWKIHAGGEIAALASGAISAAALAEIGARCSRDIIDFPAQDYRPYSEGVQTGPRWNCLRRVQLGENEGLMTLELPEAFAADLEDYPLHPALLDNATSGLVKYFETGGFLPFSYRGLKIHAPLPRRFYAHGRYLLEENAKKPLKTINLEVTLMDEQGNLVASVSAFTLLTVENHGKDRVEEAQQRYPLPSALSAAGKGRTGGGLDRAGVSKYAIAPEEGVEVFRRILGDCQPHVAVSTRDLHLLLHPPKPADLTGSAGDAVSSGDTVHARAIQSGDYLAPRSQTEQDLARIMEEFLGIDRVGVRDDFFELGIDSLKAVNLSAKFQKQLNVEVPFSEIFNRPSIEELAHFVEGGAAKPAGLDIEPVEDKEFYPVSSQQKRLYALQQVSAKGTAYNIPFPVELPGDMKLDVPHLESLFMMLIQRHESLRTSFRLEDEEPVQVIHESVPFTIESYDLTTAGGKSINEFIRPFDLGRAPLLRAALLKLAPDRQVLLVDIHHIIVDGRSLVVLVDDFAAFLEGRELAPLTLRYRDYLRWRRERMERGPWERQQQYWQEQFNGTIPRLNLPTDFPRPPIQDFRGSRLSFEADEETARALKILAQTQQTTLFMVLLAAFNVLLARVSRQYDIIVGTPAAGRSHPDLEPLIGMFVNTLALRNFPAGEKTFAAFLSEVKQRSAQAFDNQEYPFETLLEMIDVKRDTSRNPLYDAGFQLHTQFDDFEYGAKEFELEHTAARVDLGLTAREDNGKIVFVMVYAAALFKEETCQRFRDYFNDIIKAVIANPNITITGIELSHDLAAPQTDVSAIDFGF